MRLFVKLQWNRRRACSRFFGPQGRSLFFGCQPIRNTGSYSSVVSEPTFRILNNYEEAKPALFCGVERSSAPRNGGCFGGNVVAVTMKKRFILLLLTALLIPSVTSFVISIPTNPISPHQHYLHHVLQQSHQPPHKNRLQQSLQQSN